MNLKEKLSVALAELEEVRTAAENGEKTAE